MLNKKILIIPLVILFLIIGFTGYYISNSKNFNLEASKNFKDAKYIIDNKFFVIKNAESTNENNILRYFGNKVESDVNGDGLKDITFLAIHAKENLFYVFAAINTEKGYIGSRGYLIGRDILPQTSEVGPLNTIFINYAEKDLTLNISNGKTLRLAFNNEKMEFENIENGLNSNLGNPDEILISKEWTLEKAIYNDSKEFVPKIHDSFGITFDKNGTFSAKSDCNNIGGNYIYNENQLSFKDIVRTEMFCAESEEETFLNLLEETQTYLLDNSGKLILNLRFDSGSVIFK